MAHDRIPTLLASLDVIVVPSVWIENSPFVIEEAFAAGVPVVASNLGGMAELVEDGRNGLLFEAGDATGLRRVIARLLEEPGLLARLREGLPRVKSIDEDAAWTQSIYEDVLAATPGRPAAAARPSIAAVILNYNTPDDTLLAVRSLQASRRPLDHLIVVDNGPGDACEQALAPLMDAIHFSPQPWQRRVLRRVQHRDPGGAGCGRGHGAARQQRRGPGARRPRAPGTCAWPRLPEAGLAAPLIVSRAEPGIVGSAGIAYSTASGRMRHEGFGGRTEDLCEGPAQAADVVSGCVMLIRKSVFEQIGDFRRALLLLVRGHRVLPACAPRWTSQPPGAVGARVPRRTPSRSARASASRLYYAARNHLLLAQDAAPLTGLRAFARAAGIVLLNVAYALRAPGMPRLAALQAVARGTVDHLKGRYGNEPRQASVARDFLRSGRSQRESRVPEPADAEAVRAHLDSGVLSPSASLSRWSSSAISSTRCSICRRWPEITTEKYSDATKTKKMSTSSRTAGG